MDGWDRVSAPECPGVGGQLYDCDDGDGLVNPAMPEDPSTDVDDDCDGLTQLYQPVEAAMGFGVWFNATNAVFSGDGAVMNPTAASDATVSLKNGFSWDYGMLHVAVGLTENPPSTPDQQDCDVELTTDAYTGTFVADLVEGEQVVAFALDPPYEVTDLTIRCSRVGGGDTVVIDYMNVLNGDYTWRPPADNEVDSQDTKFPGGGATMTIVRLSGSRLFAAGNTSGVAESTDGGVSWQTINGTTLGASLMTQEDLAVQEIAVANGDLYVLTGREGSSSVSGGLFRSADSGTSWIQLETTAAAERTLHRCSGDGGAAHAGGQLFAQHSPDSLLFYANHATGYEGVYGWDILYDVACDSPLDGLPGGERASALAKVTVEGEPYLLVGYKSQASNADALYACPLDGSCSSGDTASPYELSSGCVALSGSGWDVRDLAPQADGDEVIVYVADAGRRDGVSACTQDEATVHAARLWIDASGLSWSLWDTDDASYYACDDTLGDTGCPTWMASGYPPQNPLGDSTEWGTGELRSKHDGSLTSNELTGLALEPDSGTLLAFLSYNSVHYAAPRVYRSDVSGLPSTGTLLDWHPLQDFYSTDVLSDPDPANPPGNAEQRAAAVDDDGSWLRSLDDYDARERRFPRTAIDGVFLSGAEGDVIVSSGFGAYRLPHSGAGGPGWDTAYGTASGLDLDEIPWSWAMSPDGDFQQTVVRGLALCHDCGPTNAGLAWGATWDLGLQRLFGRPPGAGARTAGLWSCFHDTWSAGGADADFVSDGAGGGTAWVALRQQNTPSSGPTAQAILKGDVGSADTHDDVSWCFETTADYHQANDTTFFDEAVGGTREWRCARYPQHISYTLPTGCDVPTAAPSEQGELLSGLGNANRIEGLEDHVDVAVASFVAHHDGSAYTADGGLVLVHTNGSNMLVDQVPFNDVTSTCSPSDDNDLAAVNPVFAIDQATSWWTDATHYDLRIWYLAAGDSSYDEQCSLFEVVVSADGGAMQADWTPIPLGVAGTECEDTLPDRMQGVTAAPWWPDQLFVWAKADWGSDGGICSIDTDGGTTYERVTPADGKRRDITAVAVHPHVAETLVVGMSVLDDTVYTYDQQALYQAGYRYRPGNGTWDWDWRRFDLVGLPDTNMGDIQVMSGAANLDTESIWLATAGSGVWEGELSWSE